MNQKQEHSKTKHNFHINKNISSKIKSLQKPIKNKCSLIMLLNSVFLLIPLILFTVFILLKNKTKIYDQEYNIMWSENKKFLIELGMIQGAYTRAKQEAINYQEKINELQEKTNSTEKKIQEYEKTIKHIKGKIEGDNPGKYDEYVSLEKDYGKLLSSYEGIKNRLYNELVIENSRILKTMNEILFLFEKIGVKDINKMVCKLCFSSEVDGISSNTFHKRCNGLSPTLVLYQTTKTRFGGYTEEIWESNEETLFKKDKKAFVFNLDTFKVYIQSNVSDGIGIMTGIGYFPSFGLLDIAITDNHGASKFPNSFNVYIDDDISKIPEENELTNYEKEFNLEIIEVYEIQYIDS